jgi:hypothetical protein
MSVRIAVSDALTRRVADFPPGKLYAFQLACADVAKARAVGEKAFNSPRSGREFFIYKLQGYSLYYSLLPAQPGSLVIEEFLSGGEEDTILDTFTEGAD